MDDVKERFAYEKRRDSINIVINWGICPGSSQNTVKIVFQNLYFDYKKVISGFVLKLVKRSYGRQQTLKTHSNIPSKRMRTPS